LLLERCGAFGSVVKGAGVGRGGNVVDAKGLLTLTVELDPDQFTLTLGAAVLGLFLLRLLLLLLLLIHIFLSSLCTVETAASIF
jgi:hypothetical protein